MERAALPVSHPTPEHRALLDRIEAAFGSGRVDHRSRAEILHDAIADRARLIARLEDERTEHAAWRAAMAAKNPGALTIHTDRGPDLLRQIERYRGDLQKAAEELYRLTQPAEAA